MSPSPGLWGIPLVPFYAAAQAARAWGYARGILHARRGAVPVISVGGLEVGGSGKTPVARWLCEHLAREGFRPGLLARGYGRQTRDLAVWTGASETAAPELLGDELASLVREGLRIPMAASRERWLGVEALVRAGCGCVVLDDGFAHRQLARELDIVVLDAHRALEQEHLLPWGRLREPPSALKRAHVIWMHQRRDAPVVSAPAIPGTIVVRSRLRPLLLEGVITKGAPVLCASGIAKPGDFAATLQEMGAHVVAERRFADHHRFTEREAMMLMREAQEAGALLAVTSKDAVKLQRFMARSQMVVVAAGVELESGEVELKERLAKLFCRR